MLLLYSSSSLFCCVIRWDLRTGTLSGDHTPQPSTLSVSCQEWTAGEYISLVRVNQDEALLWLFLKGSLLEYREAQFDLDDQLSQISQREFREVAMRMDSDKSLSLDHPPGLVLREATTLLRRPSNEAFPPRIGEVGLRVVDEEA